ncbi:SMI1/KNR4 family protein [Flagellimonas iocasae]|uniref:SMI1/KNR4 family protein n=1 Tax=Flagellimonas iocasae TaxID=2055905 RepID=A0ABW4XX68_9FLAO
MSNLKERLKAAGVVSQEQIDKLAKLEKEEAMLAFLKTLEEERKNKSIEGITAYHLFHKPTEKSFSKILGWQQEWFDEISAAGHQEKLHQSRIEKASQSEKQLNTKSIKPIEQNLGFLLPESYKNFLLKIGCVRYAKYAQTIHPKDYTYHIAEIKTILETLIAPPIELEPYIDNLQLLPILAVDGNYDFVLCNNMHKNQEGVFYFVYHDEAFLYGGQTNMYDWLTYKFEEMMFKFANG